MNTEGCPVELLQACLFRKRARPTAPATNSSPVVSGGSCSSVSSSVVGAPQRAPTDRTQAEDSDTSVPSGGMDVCMDLILNSHDLLKVIFEFLDVQELCTCASVCRLWRQVSDSDDFWCDVSFESRHITREQLVTLCSRHTNIKRLNLCDVQTGYGQDHIFCQILSKLQSLQYLKLGKEMLSDVALKCMHKSLLALTELVLSEVTLGRMGPVNVTLGLEKATSISLLHCRAGRLVLDCPLLRHLTLKGSQFTALTASCPLLTDLDVSGCPKLMDNVLRAAVIQLGTLKRLNVAGTATLSDDSVREFAQHLTVLEELDMSGCNQITLTGVRHFLALRVISLRGCEALAPAAVIPALESCARLEEAYLDGCTLLSYLHLHLPQLRVLSLTGCLGLEDLSLKCRALAKLLLGFHGTNGSGCRVLKTISLASDALSHMEWSQFSALEHVHLNCPNLTYLSLTDCDSLRGSLFDAISDSEVQVLKPSRSQAVEPAPESSRGRCRFSRLARICRIREQAATGAEGAEAAGEGLFQRFQHLLQEAGHIGGGLESITNTCEEPVVDQEDLTDTGPGSSDQMLGPVASTAPAGAMDEVHVLTQKTGGCPRLEVLAIDGCDRMEDMVLRHKGLKMLKVGCCKRLMKMSLHCPAMNTLKLEECGNLKTLVLQKAELLSLSLGSCSSLTSLALSAQPLAHLDLKGCGRLRALQLDCPSLKHLDATFCSELDDLGLVMATAKQPLLEDLVLSVCCQVIGRGLWQSLSSLQYLKALDLSYTGVDELSPIFRACPFMERLSLASCRSIEPQGFMGFLVRGDSPPVLPRLNNLDVSYCRLPREVVGALLQRKNLEVLAMNGCESVTSDVWPQLNDPTGGLGRGSSFCTGTAPPRSLSSLSLVKCMGLRSLCLGLLPGPGEKIKVHKPRQYAAESPSEASGQEGGYNWQPCPCRLEGLQSLRLGLSGVQVLALRLPHLTQLDLNSNTQLRCLELQCPLLLTLYMQACKVPPIFLEKLLANCRSLKKMDMQHHGRYQEVDVQSLRARHPNLGSVLSCGKNCPLCKACTKRL